MLSINNLILIDNIYLLENPNATYYPAAVGT